MRALPSVLNLVANITTAHAESNKNSIIHHSIHISFIWNSSMMKVTRYPNRKGSCVLFSFQ